MPLVEEDLNYKKIAFLLMFLLIKIRTSNQYEIYIIYDIYDVISNTSIRNDTAVPSLIPPLLLLQHACACGDPEGMPCQSRDCIFG